MEVVTQEKPKVDPSDLVKRYCNIFRLRNVGGVDGVDGLIQAFAEHPSNLLRHEICYCLGQVRHARAVEFLKGRLEDHEENAMVRHEAAEALGAIGEVSTLSVLEHYKEDPSKEVSQTCELAVSLINLAIEENKKKSNGEQIETEESSDGCRYYSFDPAPPPPPSQCTDVKTLRNDLLNPKLPMFERYRALFGLRNMGGKEAVEALCQVLREDHDSALLRHEVAYVLGQIRDPNSVDALSERLNDISEHEMVRHEAAEALGCIAPESQKELLAKYVKDPCQVVADSCEVALAMYDEESFIYI